MVTKATYFFAEVCLKECRIVKTRMLQGGQFAVPDELAQHASKRHAAATTVLINLSFVNALHVRPTFETLNLKERE